MRVYCYTGSSSDDPNQLTIVGSVELECGNWWEWRDASAQFRIVIDGTSYAPTTTQVRVYTNRPNAIFVNVST